MNIKTYFLLLLSVFTFSKTKAQCPSNFIKQYTSTINMVKFTDFTNIPTNWKRDYTQWDYNDGSAIDTGLTTSHTFPSAITYTVTKITSLSEIANPSNFCIATSIFVVDASLSSPTSICAPLPKFKVKWLTGLTYGVSSYAAGPCAYNFLEAVVDTGNSVTTGTGGPMLGIYSTQQQYFTYTKFDPQYRYSITQHLNYPDPNQYGGDGNTYYFVFLDSVHTTPPDCHASFFMQPSDSTFHNWTIQDYSSSSDSISYLWDFGDGNTSTLSSPSHTYSSIGMYTICLTVSSTTCSDTYCETAFVDTTANGSGILSINVQKMLATGIAENKKQESLILLFPNPAHNSLDISYPFKKEDYTITITNLLGQPVLIQNVNDLSAGTVKLNIEDLNSGIYLLQINSKSGNTSKTRFIKE